MVCDYGMSEVLGPVKFSPDESQGGFFRSCPVNTATKRRKPLMPKSTALLPPHTKTQRKSSPEHAVILTALKDALLKYENP